jgi:hypothetical protein
VDIVVAGSAEDAHDGRGRRVQVPEAEILEALGWARGDPELSGSRRSCWGPQRPRHGVDAGRADAELRSKVEELAAPAVAEALNLGDKQERNRRWPR